MSVFWPIIEIKHAVFNLKRCSVSLAVLLVLLLLLLKWNEFQMLTSICLSNGWKWVIRVLEQIPYTVRLTVVMQHQQNREHINSYLNRSFYYNKRSERAHVHSSSTNRCLILLTQLIWVYRLISRCISLSPSLQIHLLFSMLMLRYY